MQQQSPANMGVGKNLLLGIQHLFAMFGSTVLVPILVQGYGLPLSIQTTLFFARSEEHTSER